MRKSRSVTASPIVLVSAVALSSCGSIPVSMPKASTHGSTANRFVASFPYPPSEQTFVDGGSRLAQYGVGILSTEIFIDRASGTLTVDVSAVSLTNIVPKNRERPFLRSYLPTRHGGRIGHWHGHLAASAFVPGCDPSGQCVGTIGSLVVLQGTALFNFFTHQDDLASAKAEIRSFRLIG